MVVPKAIVEKETLENLYEMEISEIFVVGRHRIDELEKQREDVLKRQAGDSDRYTYNCMEDNYNS